jgi:hypothetical protein
MHTDNPSSAAEVVIHYRRNDQFCGLRAFAYDINTTLRVNRQLSDAQAEAVRLLDAEIASADPSDSTRVFYRGCSEEDFRSCEQGEDFVCWSYLSLSSDPLEAAFFAKNHTGGATYLLSVIIPPGTRLLRISDSTAGTLEKEEWLAPRGLRFQIHPWNGTSGLNDEDICRLQIQVPHARNLRLELIT